jgi:hypothetical protein
LRSQDFSAGDIAKIAIDKATTRDTGTIPVQDGLLEGLTDLINDKHGHEMAELNAGLAANLAEAAQGARVQRVHGLPPAERKETEPLCLIDFGIGDEPKDSIDEAKDHVDEAVANLIGMVEAKAIFSTYVKKMRYVEMTGDFGVLKKCMNMVITGNPGSSRFAFA